MYTKGKWKATKSGVGGRNWKIVAEVPETKTKTKHNVWIGTIYEKEDAVGICQCVNNFDDLLDICKAFKEAHKRANIKEDHIAIFMNYSDYKKLQLVKTVEQAEKS